MADLIYELKCCPLCLEFDAFYGPFNAGMNMVSVEHKVIHGDRKYYCMLRYVTFDTLAARCKYYLIIKKRPQFCDWDYICDSIQELFDKLKEDEDATQ